MAHVPRYKREAFFRQGGGGGDWRQIEEKDRQTEGDWRRRIPRDREDDFFCISFPNSVYVKNLLGL